MIKKIIIMLIITLFAIPATAKITYDVGTLKHMTEAMSRLVFSGNRVLALIKGTERTVTSTSHEVREFETEQESLDYIGVSGLIYEPPELEEEEIGPEEIEEEI